MTQAQPKHANIDISRPNHTSDSKRNKSISPSRPSREDFDRAQPTVDVNGNRWPYCIVWTPLPVISWLVPIIGHTGIANSQGLIYDFSDDYNVSVDNFSFGRPTKYYQLHLTPMDASSWNKAISETSEYYARTRHSLFFNNCHQYIAGALNKVKYLNRTSWSQTDVWWLITFRSTYTDFPGFARQWIPFMGIMLVALLIVLVLFS